MTYLLDTNTCIGWLRQNQPQIVARIQAQAQTDIVLCSVVVGELLFGVQRSDPAQRANTALRVEQLQIRIDKAEKGTTAAYAEFDEADLMDGDVTVRVTHSTVNYKDGLALTGKGPIIRKWPLIPGIDFSGTVDRLTDGVYHATEESVSNRY